MTTEIDYRVKTDAFEGPAELLLDLVEKRKLFINEISLAKITDDYITHIKEFQKLPADLVSGFLVVAATLVLIKSKSLLPALSLDEEKEKAIQELQSRLREYERVRGEANHIRRLFGSQSVFPKKGAPRASMFAPGKTVSSVRAAQAMREVVSRLPKKVALPRISVQKIISLEEMIGRLIVRVTENLKISFLDFSEIGKTEKRNVIVSFLALLELVKQGVVIANQKEYAGDIHIETRVLDVPRYGAPRGVGSL